MNGISKENKYLMILSVLFFTLFISACDRSSSDVLLPDTPNSSDNSGNPDTPSSAPLPGPVVLNKIVLGNDAPPNTLVFSWKKSVNADNYTLCQFDDSNDFSDNCKSLEKGIETLTTQYIFPIAGFSDIENATFFVIAKNDAGQRLSNEEDLDGIDYSKFIIYLKAGKNDKTGKNGKITIKEHFGGSVAISKDGLTLAVGVGVDNGEDHTIEKVLKFDRTIIKKYKVYIFSRSEGKNDWTRKVDLNIPTAPKIKTPAGYSVSLSDNGATLVVGAYSNCEKTDDCRGDTITGAAYIFARSGDSWTNVTAPPATLIPTLSPKTTKEVPHQFGYSVSISGDGQTVAVGAYRDDTNLTNLDNTGVVYIFTRNDSDWSNSARLQAFNKNASDWFGYSVSLNKDGTTLAVGAVKEDSDSGNDPTNNRCGKKTDTTCGTSNSNPYTFNAGAVYVFTRANSKADTVWSELEPVAYLKASNISAKDYFGTSVSLSNDGKTLAVGAPFEDSNGKDEGGDDSSTSFSGAAYVFTFDGEKKKWSKPAYIKASTPWRAGFFGQSVSLSKDGKMLAVGAPGESSNILGDELDKEAFTSGAAYIFTLKDSKWSQQNYLKAFNIGAADLFGYSVSLGGTDDSKSNFNTLAVGASYEDSSKSDKESTDNLSTNSGAVYLY